MVHIRRQKFQYVQMRFGVKSIEHLGTSNESCAISGSAAVLLVRDASATHEPWVMSSCSPEGIQATYRISI